jgi:hypothetical protein
VLNDPDFLQRTLSGKGKGEGSEGIDGIDIADAPSNMRAAMQLALGKEGWEVLLADVLQVLDDDR